MGTLVCRFVRQHMVCMYIHKNVAMWQSVYKCMDIYGPVFAFGKPTHFVAKKFPYVWMYVCMCLYLSIKNTFADAPQW